MTAKQITKIGLVPWAIYVENNLTKGDRSSAPIDAFLILVDEDFNFYFCFHYKSGIYSKPDRAHFSVIKFAVKYGKVVYGTNDYS